MRWFSGLLALECLLALAQGAPARAAGIDEGLVAARDMAGLYQRLCLEAFPNPAALAGVLKAAGARALAGVGAGADAADLLHGAPGGAWEISTAVATYQITLLDAPFNSCAVQRMSPDGLSTRLPYREAVRAYARAKSLKLGEEESLGDGGDLTILATPMGGDARHKATESSMYVVTNYHGHYAGWNVPATIGGPGVQIRMTHQIVTMR